MKLDHLVKQRDGTKRIKQKSLKLDNRILENKRMIQTQTYLNVADNSGARKIMCIRILGGNRKYAGIGDVIIGVVKMQLLICL